MLKIEIVRFVDSHQPGWVEAQFFDTNGRCHKIIDKVPAFVDSAAALDEDSVYPQPGDIVCEILSTSKDEGGRTVAHITIARPYSMESTDGLVEFDVWSGQVSPVQV
jgi:hypothetical protein